MILSKIDVCKIKLIVDIGRNKIPTPVGIFVVPDLFNNFSVTYIVKRKKFLI
jgi:hypothetical protein